MTWGGTGICRHRYGSCELWTLDDDLAGSGARRFADLVDLFFRSGDTSLVVDVRLVGLVDSIGADALTRCRDAHPGLRVVGRPASWDSLTVAVRRSLMGLGPQRDLESAFAAALRSPAADEQRRHPRIPLQLPVDLLVGGRRTTAALLDISRGGVHLSHVHEQCLAALQAGGGFSILGLAANPLGRELTGVCGVEPVPAAPVRAAAPADFGASFFGSPPPV